MTQPMRMYGTKCARPADSEARAMPGKDFYRAKHAN
jgi:hypothetical protein